MLWHIPAEAKLDFQIAIFTETEFIMKSDKKKKDLDPKKLSTILENAKYVYMLTLIKNISQLKLLITEGISRSQYWNLKIPWTCIPKVMSMI